VGRGSTLQIFSSRHTFPNDSTSDRDETATVADNVKPGLQHAISQPHNLFNQGFLSEA
jgi:hypothetical protein